MNATAIKSRTGLGVILACAVAFALTIAALALAPASAYADGYDVGPRKGATFTVGGNKYKVTDRAESDGDPGEVILVKYGSSSKKPNINTIKYRGKRYEVEAIGSNAFNNSRGHRITSITLGRNVDRIGAKAFYGCSRLKTVNIAKSDVIDVDYEYGYGYELEEVNIGPKAFAKGAKGVTVKCGGSSASYKNLVKRVLISKGMKSSVRVVR